MVLVVVAKDDISAITVDDTDTVNDIVVTNVIPGVPTSHISRTSGHRTMFCMPGVDQPPKEALGNVVVRGVWSRELHTGHNMQGLQEEIHGRTSLQEFFSEKEACRDSNRDGVNPT